jgi:Mn-dependent DtxR family transcriptional regulator
VLISVPISIKFMPYAITELEKTILLAFLISSKGNIKKFISGESVVRRFKVRQRRMVAMFMEKLVKKGMLEKRYRSYRLTDGGVKVARGLLVTGAGLWYYSKS